MVEKIGQGQELKDPRGGRGSWASGLQGGIACWYYTALQSAI